MKEDAHRPSLLRTRKVGFIALGIVVLCASRDIFNLYYRYVIGRASWFDRYHFPPSYLSLGVDIFTAVVFTFGLIFVMRQTRATERLFLAIAFAAIILEPLRDLKSATLVHFYRWLCITTDFALIPIGVQMCRALPQHAAPEDASPEDGFSQAS